MDLTIKKYEIIPVKIQTYQIYVSLNELAFPYLKNNNISNPKLLLTFFNHFNCTKC